MTGFIENLPHDLAVSFRSTLAEAEEANLHLHVIDASGPAMRDQCDVTRKVLAEIGADEHPRLLILNKCDLLDEEQQSVLASEFPEAVLMAASLPEDVLRLHGLIRDFFEGSMEEETFVIPYDQQAKVGLLYERCRVLDELYEEDGAHVRVLAPAEILEGLRRGV